MMKVTKNGKSFFVNSYNGSLFGKLFRASVSFYMSLTIDGFWRNMEKGRYENETFAIFDKFLDKNHTFIDLGAWYGPTTLYGCQIAKHCFAVEPDPVAYQVLIANLELNPSLKRKITIYYGAISNKTGKEILSSRFGTLGDTMSSLLVHKSANSISVHSMTFDDFYKKYKIKNCNFIKMDIEGAESIILPNMHNYIKQNKPTIHLSLHPLLFRELVKDTDKIMQIINLYKHVYSLYGKPVSQQSITTTLFSKRKIEIVLTDRNWNN